MNRRERGLDKNTIVWCGPEALRKPVASDPAAAAVMR
jgi:hypothetical protein